MSDTEYEKFEINDYDLENEFNPSRGRRRPTKNQQIYGIWADDDSDDGAAQSTSNRGRPRQEGRRTKDFTAPIGFVAGGVQQSGKKKEEVVEKEENGKRRLNFVAIKTLLFVSMAGKLTKCIPFARKQMVPR